MLNFVFLFVVGWGIEGLDVCMGEGFIKWTLFFFCVKRHRDSDIVKG
jgi:hypothetical protein